MAHATIVEETPAPPPKKVILEMKMEEAEILLAVLRKVTGNPAGPMGAIDALYEALTVAGVYYAVISTRSLSGSLEISRQQ